MSDIKNFERNKYFYGKLMTVRDFETEQSYFIEKQRLINRLIHGAGVVCGLRIEQVGDTTEIKIYPGVAIDCCGRDIIVPEEKVVNLKEEYSPDDNGEIVYVLLKYDFCEKESVPVINNVSACEETCCYNRILETYKIEISDTMPKDCTPADGELCDDWPNHSRVSAKTEPVLFERIMPKLIKTGEVFKVTVKAKARVDLFSFTIEDTLPSDLELYNGSLSLEREDIKSGETIYNTYLVNPKETTGKFGIEGKMRVEVLEGEIETIHLPESSVSTTETPDEEKAKSFVEYWIKGCPECPEDPAVVLAAITLQKSDGSFKIGDIDNAVIDEGEFKKSLVFSNPRLYELIKCVEKEEGPMGPPGPGLEEGLTVIEEITPKFEARVSVKDFVYGDIKDIKVTFSKEIQSVTVNNDTFQVAVFAPIRKGDLFMHHYVYIEGVIEGANDNDNKTFTFKPNALDETISQFIDIQPDLKILVHIKCDFIKDVTGKAVAGHHLHENQSGLNIDGNGKYDIQGGIFESWFTLFTQE